MITAIVYLNAFTNIVLIYVFVSLAKTTRRLTQPRQAACHAGPTMAQRPPSNLWQPYVPAGVSVPPPETPAGSTDDTVWSATGAWRIHPGVAPFLWTPEDVGENPEGDAPMTGTLP